MTGAVWERARRVDPPTALMIAGLCVSGALILVLDRGIGFYLDEWDFLLGRRGFSPGIFLEPHHEHIAVVPVAVYKLLIAGFGVDSTRPFQIVGMLSFLAAVALVFVYLRRRLGSWLALAASAPLLVFGPAWDNVLWPFQIGFSGAIACGVAALLALERRDRRGDIQIGRAHV